MKISNSSVDELQAILQKDLKRRVTNDEAKQIGKWLLKFYTHLGSTNAGNGKKPTQPQ